MSTWLTMGLQDANSPLMRELIFFHDLAMLIVIMILFFVGYSMIASCFNPWTNSSLTENQSLESFWTIMPAVILVALAMPSLILLYLHDAKSECGVHIKVTGFQWFWNYEYLVDNNMMAKSLEFDAYMVGSSASPDQGFARLDTDSRLELPTLTPIRFLITSGDVLHSWALPSLALKADAAPGRLNQLSSSIERPGLFFGQCSEICGANHSFMPIVIEAVPCGFFVDQWMPTMMS